MKKLNDFLTKVGAWLQSPILLIFRLAWGFQLVESGQAHLGDVAGMVKRFEGWHIPFPMLSVYMSASTELAGGILLMIGLGARLVSIPLFFNFCVAYLTASIGTVKELFHFKSGALDDFINDTAFPFLITSILILAFGPGKISLDFLLGKFLGPKPAKGANP